MGRVGSNSRGFGFGEGGNRGGGDNGRGGDVDDRRGYLLFFLLGLRIGLCQELGRILKYGGRLAVWYGALAVWYAVMRVLVFWRLSTLGDWQYESEYEYEYE